jgi:hypothetical protein
VFPVRYELRFYIPEDGIIHSHCRDDLKSYKSAVYNVQNCARHTVFTLKPTVEVLLTTNGKESAAEASAQACLLVNWLLKSADLAVNIAP